MNNTSWNRVRRSLGVGVSLVLVLLVACGDGSGAGRGLAPVDVLPASTRGLLQLSATPAGEPWSQPIPDAVAPWRHSALDILRHYATGLDLAAGAEQSVLAQLTTGGDDFALLLVVRDGAAKALLGAVDPQPAGRYRGVRLEAIPGGDLLLARVDRSLWVVAPSRAIEKILDTASGSAPDIGAGLLAPYLDVLARNRMVSFTYGLPALYRPVPTPGSGAVSLAQATVASAAFDLEQGVLDGHLYLVSANADAYRERLVGLLGAAAEPLVTSSAGTLSVDLGGMSAGPDGHRLLKTLFIDMDAVDYAEAVIQGGNAPWLNFFVGENPNSIFINFEFRDAAARAEFEAQHLPRGFTLVPIRILETDTPRYFLVLNIYQSSGGLVSGARAEWSVFIRDPDDERPRFLVVQASAESISADSVNLLTPPEPVSHLQETDAISSYVGVVNAATEVEETYFSSRIPWPAHAPQRAAFQREFVAANDFIFWGNAVADRGLYNGTVHNRDAIVVDAAELQFQDNSRWAGFINAQPVHTLVYLNPLEIVISPWWNLDADYLDVTAAYRQQLITFKNGFYPATMLNQAEAAVRGEGLALVAATAGETLPTTRFHFEITAVDGLFARLGIAEVFTPQAIALRDGDTARHYLSLALYARENDICGQRAEWTTYVRGAQGRPQTLRLQGLAGDACLDPDALLGLPAIVEQQVTTQQVSARLQAQFQQFAAQLDLALGMEQLSGRDWIEAGDQVCSTVGVCDAVFYDGQTLAEPVLAIDPSGVEIQSLVTPWDEFIQPEPVLVTVARGAAVTAANPWRNVRAIVL